MARRAQVIWSTRCADVFAGAFRRNASQSSTDSLDIMIGDWQKPDRHGKYFCLRMILMVLHSSVQAFDERGRNGDRGS